MQYVVAQSGATVRLGLGTFSILIAIAGLAPGIVPAEFAHLSPDLDTAEVWTVQGYFASNVILLLSGIKLMFGVCTKSATALAVTLLAFNIYLVGTGFSAPLWTFLLTGAFCAAVLAYIYIPKLRWDVKQPI